MAIRLMLGQIVATPGAAAVLTPDDITDLLRRHQTGDWGTVDAEDRAANDAAVRAGERVLSAYVVRGTKVWVITEWNRSVTTFLLPEEY